MDELRAVDERLPGRRDELAQLLDRGLAEDGRGVADEVDPELTRRFLGLGRRPEPHQSLFEAVGLQPAGERLLDDEQDAVPAPLQDLADPDAVVGRAERALGKEHNRLSSVSHV